MAPAEDDLLSAMFMPYSGGLVRKMSVHIYTVEKCGACGSGFDQNMKCSKHPSIRPQKIYLQITGVKNYPGRRQRIFSDPVTRQPLTLVTGLSLKMQIQSEIHQGTYDSRKYDPIQSARLLYSNYVVEYLEKLEQRTKKAHDSRAWLSQSAYIELEKYQRLYLLPHFGNYFLKDIDRAEIKKFLDTLTSVTTGTDASDTIKKKARDGIRHLLNHAVSEGDIPPLQFQFPELEAVERVIRYLDPEDQELIIAAAPEHVRPLLRWLVKTGRRVNEARALKVKDVIFSKMEYVVGGAFDRETYKPFPKVKETGGSVFPLDEELVAIVRESLAGRVYGPEDYVFINPKSGGPYTMNALGNLFSRARKIAGFQNITLNEFGRHSWATQRLSEGWSFEQVALFLLNTAEIVKDRYARVTKAARIAVINMHKNTRRRKENK